LLLAVVSFPLWVHRHRVEGINVIERAFQLATESASLDEVKRKLTREGYFHVERHLSGRQIRADITSRLNREPEPE